MRSLLFLISCLFFVTTSATAQDYTFDSVNDTTGLVDINFGSSGGVFIPGLTASMTLTLLSINADGGNNIWSFGGSVSNTSSGDITASRITALGFNVNETVVSATAGDGAGNEYFDFVSLNSNISNATWLNVCLWGSGSCAGGGGGILIGDSMALTFNLTVANNIIDLVLSDLTVRYQAVDGTLYSGSGSAIGTVTTIPEPATWLMMIIGFSLVAASARRSRRTEKRISQHC